MRRFGALSVLAPLGMRFALRALSVPFVAAAIALGGCKGPAPRPDFAHLVDIGHGRKIFLACSGSGTPTVVLVAGGFEAGWIYNYALDRDDPAVTQKSYDAFSAGGGHPRKTAAAVFPSVARFTRVCSYDRPNTTAPQGRSERNGSISTRVAQPHELKSDVADLHSLLAAGGETGPFVLVGHSYGGLIVELFASTYPKDVAGLVLLDITSQYIKQMETPQEYAALVAAGRKAQNAAGERLELGRAIDAVLSAPAIPPVPAVVFVANKHNKGESPAMAAHIAQAQLLLAKRLNANLITNVNSGHHIHVEQPQLVIAATREVVEAARKANGSAAP